MAKLGGRIRIKIHKLSKLKLPKFKIPKIRIPKIKTKISKPIHKIPSKGNLKISGKPIFPLIIAAFAGLGLWAMYYTIQTVLTTDPYKSWIYQGVTIIIIVVVAIFFLLALKKRKLKFSVKKGEVGFGF